MSRIHIPLFWGLRAKMARFFGLHRRPRFAERVPIDEAGFYGNGEVVEPVEIEVLFNDQPVALLTDRQIIETFWRSYKVTPLRAELKEVIENPDNWNSSKITFRDTRSGKLCPIWYGE